MQLVYYDAPQVLSDAADWHLRRLILLLRCHPACTAAGLCRYVVIPNPAAFQAGVRDLLLHCRRIAVAFLSLFSALPACVPVALANHNTFRYLPPSIQ